MQKLRIANCLDALKGLKYFHWSSLLVGLGLAMFSLSACAGAGTPSPTSLPINTPVPVNTLAPLVTSDPNCPTLMLEKWLRNATPNTLGFITLLNRSVGTKQAQAKQVAIKLAQYSTQISSVTAPICATTVNQNINIMINDVVQAFLTLSDDPRTVLQNTITTANTRYFQVQKDQQTLLNTLNTQLGQ